MKQTKQFKTDQVIKLAEGVNMINGRKERNKGGGNDKPGDKEGHYEFRRETLTIDVTNPENMMREEDLVNAALNMAFMYQQQHHLRLTAEEEAKREVEDPYFTRSVQINFEGVNFEEYINKVSARRGIDMSEYFLNELRTYEYVTDQEEGMLIEDGEYIDLYMREHEFAFGFYGNDEEYYLMFEALLDWDTAGTILDVAVEGAVQERERIIRRAQEKLDKEIALLENKSYDELLRKYEGYERTGAGTTKEFAYHEKMMEAISKHFYKVTDGKDIKRALFEFNNRK